jgi:hypothetical protein
LFSTLALFFLCLTVCAQARAQADERERAAAEVESLREQIRLREQTLLSVPAEDRERHAEFLAQPDTGLVRLLPRERWDGLLSTRGGGAYYSFTRLTHEYGHGSDLSLEQGSLSVGFAGANFGFMLNLGDAPLETLSAEAEAVRFMASFQTPEPEPEARKAQRQFAGAGAQSGQWTYKDRLPVVAGSTYALRSVNYNASDVLVAFRVLRKEADGSVVLLWKILRKYPKPSLDMSVRAGAGP